MCRVPGVAASRNTDGDRLESTQHVLPVTGAIPPHVDEDLRHSRSVAAAHPAVHGGSLAAKSRLNAKLFDVFLPQATVAEPGVRNRAQIAAALKVARARRHVLVIDVVERRNRFAANSYGFLGQDGRDPAAIAADARRHLEVA